MENFKIIIIGAGPIGLACAIEAKKRKWDHLVIEKGCLVNSIYHYPRNMTFFSTSDRLEIGKVPFISHGFKPTRSEALEYYRRVAESWDLNIHTYEKVTDVSGGVGNFTVKTEHSAYQSEIVIVASGYYDTANLMNIPGEHMPKVKHYFDEPHPYAHKKVAVIGGGNSAVDVALETFRTGAEVTLLVREPALKSSIKYWVKPDIENRINDGSIMAFFNCEVREIRETEIAVELPEGNMIIPNDFVFAMTGYRPDYHFLNKIGIKNTLDAAKNFDFHHRTFETNIPGLFLAGVACGGMDTTKWLIENSREHALNIFQYLDSKAVRGDA